jgi:hypothetical protein
MLQEQGIPAPTAGVYTNEQAPAKDISGRRLRRRLRRASAPPTARCLPMSLRLAARGFTTSPAAMPAY